MLIALPGGNDLKKNVQFLGLDGPYLALLGPLLASPASGLTPSTRRNPDPTRSRPIFDPIYFVTSQNCFGAFYVRNLPRMASGRSQKDLARNSALYWYQQRLNPTSWSNFMTKTVKLPPSRLSTLNIGHIFAKCRVIGVTRICLLYTSPSPRDRTRSRMPSSA